MADSDAVRQRRYRQRARQRRYIARQGGAHPQGETGTGWPSRFAAADAAANWRTFARKHKSNIRGRYVKPRRLGTCSDCGGPMHVGRDSAPPDRRRCGACRGRHPRVLTPRPCVVCGKVFDRLGGDACSRRCGNELAAWRRMRPGEPFDPETLAILRARRKQRRTVRSRERRLRRAETWDGVTDLEIWERDGWCCQVPECRYRSRKINRRYKYPDPRSPGIDHIVPLSLGGDDTCVNKRAAHHGCNMVRGNRMGYEQLLLIGSLREPPLRSQIAG